MEFDRDRPEQAQRPHRVFQAAVRANVLREPVEPNGTSRTVAWKTIGALSKRENIQNAGGKRNRARVPVGLGNTWRCRGDVINNREEASLHFTNNCGSSRLRSVRQLPAMEILSIESDFGPA